MEEINADKIQKSQLTDYTKLNIKPKTLNFKKWLKLSAILITFITLGFFVNQHIFRSKASQDTVVIAFEPTTKTVEVGDEFSLGLRINASEKKISAIDLAFRYNSEKLEYVPADNLPIVPPDYFSEVLVQSISGGSGQTKSFRLVIVSKNLDDHLEGNILITLKFKALHQEPSSKITFKNSSSIVGITGTDNNHEFSINSDGAEADIKINNTSPDTPKLKLGLRFQGIVNKPEATDEAKIKVYIGGKSLDKKIEFNDVVIKAKEINSSVVWEGIVNLKDIDLNAKYSLYIKGPSHMQKRFCELAPVIAEDSDGTDYHCTDDNITFAEGDNIADFSKVMLLVGDLDLPQNGILNAKDIGAIKDCLKNPSAECISKTDLNLDSVVNGIDFNLILKSMGLKYDDED